MGHFEDRHAPRQFQSIPLERGVAPPGVGEGDLHLAHGTAGRVFDTRDGEADCGGAAADGQGAKAAQDVATRDDIAEAAGQPAAIGSILSDGEDYLAAGRVGANVVVATDAEGTVQEAGGQADLPIWRDLTQLQVESACPRYLSPARATSG